MVFTFKDSSMYMILRDSIILAMTSSIRRSHHGFSALSHPYQVCFIQSHALVSSFTLPRLSSQLNPMTTKLYRSHRLKTQGTPGSCKQRVKFNGMKHARRESTLAPSTLTEFQTSIPVHVGLQLQIVTPPPPSP